MSLIEALQLWEGGEVLVPLLATVWFVPLCADSEVLLLLFCTKIKSVIGSRAAPCVLVSPPVWLTSNLSAVSLWSGSWTAFSLPSCRSSTGPSGWKQPADVSHPQETKLELRQWWGLLVFIKARKGRVEEEVFCLFHCVFMELSEPVATSIFSLQTWSVPL